MFRRHARDTFTQPLRGQFTRQSGTRRAPSALLGATALATSVAVAVTVQQVTTERIYNDTPSDSPTPTKTAREIAPQAKIEEERLVLLVWGTNRSRIISPDAVGAGQTRTPSEVSFLQDVALRDLAVHTSHAACVDARGDVYQWGDGFFATTSAQSRREPTLTLRGKNIVRVQVTESRVFALSASGKGEEAGVRHSEITPAQPLTWGEKIVSISSGRDHLLALTSSGRTFAHPISKNANTYGQLGLRKFDIPDPSSSTPTARLHVELTPRAVVDPYAKSFRYARQTSSSGSALPPVSENLVSVDDRAINFSDRFFEVPALRGVHVVQIAAGSRSSFVRTDNGRVLGWGANDYGQIGLGGSVALDTIMAPTEVVLWRNTPNGARAQCVDLNVGGDLAFFTVERIDGTSIGSIDVLSCGGGGQYGGLGNALFSNAQSVPVRIKAVSGLLELSEKTNNLQPITPQALSVSPDGHVLLTLDTHARAGPGGSGRDLLAWGTNYDYQVGNGRRASIAVPTTLECANGSRLMLNKRRAAVVRDPQGRVWRRGVDVEQVAVAGHGLSLIYWRIC
ncbi:regulator of chromosome condensation 1/beta-lactamase-inhibitor protein II [Gloeopeniophorella convolvens]|nr:regulator of chromosome condensation 1/beta-lactamase-inhibitor protein II [Gloeopeniophorella convolvens]